MGCAFAGCVGAVAQKRRGGSVPAKITMSLAKKITLENAIFFRAACLRAPVDGVRGELCSPSDDVCLQVLLSVYNAFFGAENAAFLAESGEAPTANFRSFLWLSNIPLYLSIEQLNSQLIDRCTNHIFFIH